MENYQNKQQTSSLSVSNNEKSSPSGIKTTNNRPPADVNHLRIEREGNVDVVKHTTIKQKKEQQSEEKNILNTKIKQITNSVEEQQQEMMNSDDEESDNDLELLNTLQQLHVLNQTPRLSTTEINNEKQENNCERKESTFFSLTSLTSSALFNDDESHSADIIIDSDASSSLVMSMNELNNPILSSTPLIDDDLQTTTALSPTSFQNLLYRSISTNNEDADKDDLKDYLHWIINHLNDDLQSSISNEQIQQHENKNLFSFDNEVIPTVEKSALNEINQQIEHFVDRIVSEAIYQVYNEDNTLLNKTFPTNKQFIDPFDQTFDQIWINHFQSPDDPINPNNTFDQTNLFSAISNQANNIQEPILSPLLINPFGSTTTHNDLMKYSLITSVTNINTDDRSILHKVIQFQK